MEDIGTIWILRFARIMHSFFQSKLIMISLIKVSDSGSLVSLFGFKGVARLEASGSDKQQINSPCQTMQFSPNLVKIRYNINHKS